MDRERKATIDNIYRKDEKGNETISIPAIISVDIGARIMFGNIIVYGELRERHTTTEGYRYNKKYNL